MSDNDDATMTKEEILATFALNSKDADSSNTEGLARQPGEEIWVRNVNALEGCQDNEVSRPFYKMTIIKDLKDKVECVLASNDIQKGSSDKIDTIYSKMQGDLDIVMDCSNQSEDGMPDMIDLDDLNHSTILWNLFKRYERKDIYTYVGPTLLVVNPFQKIDSPKPLEDYLAITEADEKSYYEVMKDYKRLPPHIYALSAYAHKQMIVSGTRQAIVISGESGAGKTESAKMSMAFLTKLGDKGENQSGDPKNDVPMEDRILSTNPVLEAFGNSRTARNNNSSRFGKYIKLYFDRSKGNVLGAEIKNYLLEKSRVCGCTPKERNYHVYFFMMRGCEDKLAQKIGFMDKKGVRKSWKDFKFSQVCNDLKPEDDVKDYKELYEAFINLKFSNAEVDAIHRITAASLYIGEIDFNYKTLDQGKAQKPVSINNQDILKHIANMLGCSEKRLEEEMVNREAMPGSKRTPDNEANVASAKDSLAKSLYDRMFNWLVAKMNIEILPEDKYEDNFADISNTIGLLDIFGFECFDINQFEQLCINYVNEKLHNLYLSSVFTAEKKEMFLELDRDVDLIQPKSNVKRNLLLMDNDKKIYQTAPLGIFKLVDDACSGVSQKTPQQKVEALYGQLKDNHSTNDCFHMEKRSKNKDFLIHHSAKTVKYDSSNFIERNADKISGSLVKLLIEETDSTVGQILSEKTGREKQEDVGGKKGGSRTEAPTIWGKFRTNIMDLMNELAEPEVSDLFDPSLPKPKAGTVQPKSDKTDLHFVRCLKPNDKKNPGNFAHCMTLQQITYMGVLESIRVKQVNYPQRKKYEEFYKAYELLSPSYSEGRYDLLSESQLRGKDWKALGKEILQRVFEPLNEQELKNAKGGDRFEYGKTKILMMSEIKMVIEKAKHKASINYDKYSQFIKRADKLGKANVKIIQKRRCIIKIQRFLRETYQRIQEVRAKAFQKKVREAVIAFKTEKRKVFEQEAGLVIEETYRKHIFREALNQAVVSRKFMIQGVLDLATINRCRKMWICRRMVQKVFQGAFMKAKKKKELDSIYRIQRILRGHMERAGKEDVVLHAFKRKVQLKSTVSAQKVQKFIKGFIIHNRIIILKKHVIFLQSLMRMKWTKRVYQVIKKNVIILQKAYRRYMARRDQIKVRLYQYLSQELQVIENVKAMEFSQLYGSNMTRSQAQQRGFLKTLTPYSIKKIHFFTRVIDLGIQTDLSQIYAPKWSDQWIKAMAESTLNETPILTVSAGLTHTMAINSRSKVYVWGWNDNGQCAVPDRNVNEVLLNQSSIKNAQVNIDRVIDKEYHLQIQNQGGINIKQAIAVNDRCMLLVQETNEVIVWGSNERGELGLGHYEDVLSPAKIELFSRPDVKVMHISGGGILNFACTEEGDAYAWPFIHNGIKQSLPTRMPFSDKTKILKVSCGHNFGFFVSNQGLVYSFGEENSDGQLGLGHIYPTEFPELIQCLRDIGERIDSVECGFKHAIAKSSLGKIYTWGSSNKGQLGHDHFDCELSPRALYIDKKNNKKVQLIAAGYSHCMVMMENNKEIFWFGTCGNLVEQSFPLQFDLGRYLPDLFGPQNQANVTDDNQYSMLHSNQHDFSIVKLNCSWSKTMSLTTMLIADLRAVNQDSPSQKKISLLGLQNLATKWDPKDIMPPYLKNVSGLFPANIMKKPATLKMNKVAPPKNQKQNQQRSGANTSRNHGLQETMSGREGPGYQTQPINSARGTNGMKR